MPSTINLKVTKKKSKGCSCGKDSYVYTLPISLDDLIIDSLVPFGMPALDFGKTRLLRMGDAHFNISGVKGLNQIRYTAKTKKGKDRIEDFESILDNYVQDHPKIKKRENE